MPLNQCYKCMKWCTKSLFGANDTGDNILSAIGVGTKCSLGNNSKAVAGTFAQLLAEVSVHTQILTRPLWIGCFVAYILCIPSSWTDSIIREGENCGATTCQAGYTRDGFSVGISNIFQI